MGSGPGETQSRTRRREVGAVRSARGPGVAASALATQELDLHLEDVRISPRLLGIFTRQLAIMLRSGLGLGKALHALCIQDEAPRFGYMVGAVLDDVLAGRSLSAAFARYPKVFGELYVASVRSAEAQGSLGRTLGELADLIEKSEGMKARVRTAMTYPVFVFLVTMVLAFFVFNYVLPHFVTILDGLHQELPLLTRILMGLVHVAQHPAFLIGLPLVVLAYVQQVRFLYSTTAGRRLIDRLKLSTPFIGDIYRKLALASMARCLATLIQAQIPILEGLPMAGAVCGNQVVRDHLEVVASHVRNGEYLSFGFRPGACEVFDPVCHYMLLTGEATGADDMMLGRLAAWCEQDVDHTLDRMASLMEPLLVFLTGTMVALIILAVFLPLYGALQGMGT